MNCPGRLVGHFPFACICWCLALIFFLSGCSHTSLIRRRDMTANRQKTLSITQFNQEVEHKSLTIQLRTGVQYDAENVMVSPDSTTFQSSGIGMKLPNDSVQDYRWINHLGGAGDGFLLSIIPAALLAEGIRFNDAEGRILPVLPAALMVGVTTVGAALAGAQYRYEFSSDTAAVSDNNSGVRASTSPNTANNDADK